VNRSVTTPDREPLEGAVIDASPDGTFSDSKTNHEATSSRILELYGLRGAAILFVILYHLIHEAVNFLCHVSILGDTPRVINWARATTTLSAGLVRLAIAKIPWISFENPLLQQGHATRYGVTAAAD
jgi:hypothetical protein